MHVSVKTLYALRALSELADETRDDPIHARDLADSLDMSKDYLNQILGQLRDADILNTKKGPHGGFRLSRAPEEIYLGEVIQVLEGPTILSTCTQPEYSDCDVIAECSTQNVLSNVSERILEYLNTISITEINQNEELPPIEA